MILKEFPNLGLVAPDHFTQGWAKDTTDLLQQICNIRKDDIVQANNLDQTYVAGRKVGRIPSASNDVISGDKIGDFNVTPSYAYYLVDNAGTGEWVRVAVGTW